MNINNWILRLNIIKKLAEKIILQIVKNVDTTRQNKTILNIIICNKSIDFVHENILKSN